MCLVQFEDAEVPAGPPKPSMPCTTPKTVVIRSQKSGKKVASIHDDTTELLGARNARVMEARRDQVVRCLPCNHLFHDLEGRRSSATSTVHRVHTGVRHFETLFLQPSMASGLRGMRYLTSRGWTMDEVNEAFCVVRARPVGGGTRCQARRNRGPQTFLRTLRLFDASEGTSLRSRARRRTAGSRAPRRAAPPYRGAGSPEMAEANSPTADGVFGVVAFHADC